MNSAGIWGRTVEFTTQSNRQNGVEAQDLRSRLVNLTLDWELAALALDARRYRTHEALERESLRDSATAYRKCIAALTEVLSRSSLLAGKT